MAEDRDADFETRLKKLRNPHEQNLHEDDEEEDDSPSADLAVQARVDSVALAKGRLSGGAASGPKDRLDSKEGKNRSTLPPSGAKSRLATQEKDKHTGFKGVTRKLRTSLGFGDKDKEETEAKQPPDLATHVSFNERVEELPIEGGAR